MTYAELLALPRLRRIATMRCVSNTLKSNLMGAAGWSGVFLRQLIDPARVPGGVREVAFLGAEGRDDSLPPLGPFPMNSSSPSALRLQIRQMARRNPPRQATRLLHLAPHGLYNRACHSYNELCGSRRA